MKSFAISILLLYGLASGHVNAGATSARVPVLIELFTSEGCSSCPPADTLLSQMDASQPAPGVELIVLSEHVDYWNHDGWRDPYSSSLLSDRQSAYASALGIDDVYTPQMIVDGASVLKLSNPSEMSRTIQKAAAAQTIPLKIDSVTVEANDPRMLHARIEADGKAEKGKADVYIAVALNRAESSVTAGENKGRRLTHVAVVEHLKKIATLEPGTNLNRDFRWKLKPGMEPDNLRIIAFAQEPGPGKVIGAAVEQVIPKAEASGQAR